MSDGDPKGVAGMLAPSAGYLFFPGNRSDGVRVCVVDASAAVVRERTTCRSLCPTAVCSQGGWRLPVLLAEVPVSREADEPALR